MTNSNDKVDADWFAHAFDEFYGVVYAHRSVEAAAPEAAFAIDALDLSTPHRVLDLCCGNGRHLVHLAQHASRAVGLDYSGELLVQAQSLLSDRARLVRADMRAIPFQNAFDVVTNFFTSFGYFFAKMDNMAVARGIATALKSNGRFFMDYLNSSHAAENLEPETTRRAGPYDIREVRWIDQEANRLNKRTTLTQNNVTIRNYEESVQLYTADELTMLLNEAGLRIDSIYGDYSGVAFGPETPRMIVVGSKCR